ncbi:MAG: cytochrome c peroxidase [Bacteroidota bacterium]
MKHRIYFVGFLASLLAMFLVSVPADQPQSATLAVWGVMGDSTQPLLPGTDYDYEDFFSTMGVHFVFDPDISGSEYQPATNNTMTSAGATLGRVLFYDKRLSANFTISCGSCHLGKDGFSDGKALSKGFNGQHTTRNSIGLVNSRFQPTGSFFWDASADTLQSQIRAALTSTIEMGMDLDTMVARVANASYYPQLFQNAFGNTTVTQDRIAAAIGQFVRSMASSQTDYDLGVMQVWDRTLPFPNYSNEENIGKDIFLQSGCDQCHTTHNFHMPEPINNGLDLLYLDKGVGEITNNSSDNGKFKAASLRNIGKTGPYMHDGRFATLEDVVEHYSTGIQDHPNLDSRLKENGLPKKFNFTSAEKDALVAFLRTLDDNAFNNDPRWENPFGLDSVRAVPVNRLFTPIDDEIEQKVLEVFPNPFRGHINVAWENTRAEEFRARLLDNQGRLIKEISTRDNEVRFERESLPAGTYIIAVDNGSDRMVKQVIAQ